MDEYSEPEIRDVFQIHHIASFVEGEHVLKPEDVFRQLEHLLNSDRLEETACTVKMDKRGMRVKLEKTKKTVESFDWQSLRNEAAIMNPMERFQFQYLVLFRIVGQFGNNNELHVFSCENFGSAKAFVDSIGYHKKENLSSESKDDVSSKPTLMAAHSAEKLELQSSSPGNAYEKHFQMLNKCIHSIENVEKRLEKAIKKRAASQENIDIHGNTLPSPPTPAELIETVRNVKYAFNMYEAIRPYAVERASKKIFIRLMNTVQWLDGVCKSGWVPEYNANLVVDVIEPLLNRETIDTILKRLGNSKQEFWRSLGPNWNKPSEEWVTARDTYVPQFDSSDHSSPRGISPPIQTHATRISPARPHVVVKRSPSFDSVPPRPSPSPMEQITMTTKDTGRTYGSSEGVLYTVTTRHVGSKPQELSAAPGTVVKVLDSTNVDWWLVRDPSGVEGEIPHFKLKKYDANTQDHVRERQSIKSTNITFANTSKPGLVQTPYREVDITRNRQVEIKEPSPTQSPTPSKSITRYSPVTTIIDTEIQSSRDQDLIPKSEPSQLIPENIQITSESMPVQSQQQQQQNPERTLQGTGGNVILLSPEELQGIMKNIGNLNQVPMVLIPVNEFYNLANQYNLGGSASGGLNGNFGNTDTAPMRWPELNEPVDLPSERLPTPTLMSSGIPPTSTLGFSPYPFNYPTHTQTMTRELRERLSKMREGGGNGLKSVPTPTTSGERPTGRLNKHATKEDVAEWLVAHKFPAKAISNLRGFKGMDLYTMSREQLAEHVGQDRVEEIFYAFRGS